MPDNITSPVLSSSKAIYTQLGPHTVKMEEGKLYILKMNIRKGTEPSNPENVTGYEWLEVKDATA